MNTFEQAWTMSNTYYRVSSTVRVTIQRRAMNNYTYIEDFVTGGIDGEVRKWKIRRGSVRAHGVGGGIHAGFLGAKARAEGLWNAEVGVNSSRADRFASDTP